MKLLHSLLGILAISSYAQAQSDCWTNLSAQNSGIPAAAYTSVVQNAQGDVVLGTDVGLALYNGTSFYKLSQKEFPLASQEVEFIEQGSKGTYIGTTNGYTYVPYDGTTSSVFISNYTGLRGDTVRAIQEDTLGNVWVATEQGVNIKEGINWSYLTTPDILSNHIESMVLLDDGRMALGTDQGISVVDRSSGSSVVTNYTRSSTSNGLVNNKVKCLFEDSSENLWVGTQFGISKFDGQNWTKYTVANTTGLASNDIRDFEEGFNGDIMAATAYGLTTINSSGVATHSYSLNGLAEDILSDLYFSTTDTTLYAVSNNPAAGNNNGLHIYKDGSWTNFERENTGMPSNQPLHLAGQSGQMYSGFSGGIYSRGISGISQYSDDNTNLPQNSIRDLEVDDQGNLWALTSSGMSKWDGSAFQNFGNTQGLTSSYYLGVPLSDSSFAVSNGFSTGIVIYDGSSATAYKSFNTTGLGTNTHNDLEPIPNGQLAIGTPSGLSIYDGTGFTQYQIAQGLAINNVKSLKYDVANDVLWMGYNLATSGIASMDPASGTITNYSGAALASGSITSLAVAPDSVIYFISGSSYYRYDAKIDSLTTYSSANTPVSSTVLNDIEYLNSKLWIATGNKLHVVDDFERQAVAITIGDPATCDLDSVIVASLGTYASVNWSNGESNAFTTTDSTVTLSYTATDGNGCNYYSNSLPVTIYPAPIADLFYTNDVTFCLGESNTISTWDYFETYSWNNGSTDDSLVVTDNGSFWLEIMDTNGCFAQSDTAVINVWKPYQEDSICILTVDSSNHNQIVWNKTSGVRTFEYGIYKQNPTTGDMDLVASHPATGVLSVWTDENSNAGVTSARYAISSIDSCGNESELSPIHKTMHLTINEGINGEVNLIWDGYEGIDLTTYEIWRGSSPLQMFKIDEVSAANFTYTDLNAPVGLLFYKIVVVNPYVCNPTVGKNSQLSNYGATESNVVDYALTDNVIIYPNPFSGQTRVVWSNPDLESYEIKVYDAVGRLVHYEPSITETSYDLYQNDLPSGVYAIEITNGERLLKTDFIIE